MFFFPSLFLPICIAFAAAAVVVFVHRCCLNGNLKKLLYSYVRYRDRQVRSVALFEFEMRVNEKKNGRAFHNKRNEREKRGVCF